MNTSPSNQCNSELQERLTKFMENGIKRRCKAIVKSVHDSVDTFMTMVEWTQNTGQYKQYIMPKDIYDGMIIKSKSIIKHKCEKGIDQERVNKNDGTTWHRLQNYWLRNAPEISTKYLYNDLLYKIADYFNDIAIDLLIGIDMVNPLKLDQIRDFLKKKFIFNLVTCHLQQHCQSTAKGPIIQYTAWKDVELQNIVTGCFDGSYHDHWPQWMQLNEKHGKSKRMRIDSIINQKFKPFAYESLRKCAERLQIKMEIKDFKITSKEIEQFVLFPVNIMDENNQFEQFHFDMDAIIISPSYQQQAQHSNNTENKPLPSYRSRQSPTSMLIQFDHQYRYDQHQQFIPSSPPNNNNHMHHYGPWRGSTNYVQNIMSSPPMN